MDIDLIKHFIINKLLIFISTSRTLPSMASRMAVVAGMGTLPMLCSIDV